jgi:hypothetical protein
VRQNLSTISFPSISLLLPSISSIAISGFELFFSSNPLLET